MVKRIEHVWINEEQLLPNYIPIIAIYVLMYIKYNIYSVVWV